MPDISVGTENGGPIRIHYADHGSGDVVVLSHEYPLDGTSSERQVCQLLQSGYRVVSYDRRGFGRLSRPSVGHDCDTVIADLHRPVEHLDLNNVVLVGSSMGMAEVTRYLDRYGSRQVRKAVLVSSVPPFVLKTDDNRDGVGADLRDRFKAAVVEDRFTYFGYLLDNGYNVDKLMPERISERAWQATFNIAAASSRSRASPASTCFSPTSAPTLPESTFRRSPFTALIDDRDATESLRASDVHTL